MAGLLLAACARPVFAQDAGGELSGLLDRIGARIDEFWNEYSEVAATEELHQRRLTPNGKLISESVQSYDYVIVMGVSGAELVVEESRIARTGPGPAEDAGPLLVTNGFSTLLLIFHPYFRNSFVYEASGEPSGSDGTVRVDFRAVRGQRSPAVLRLEGRNYAIQWKGSAWIDTGTGMVIRIETELAESMADLGLHSLTARTQYEAVRLGEAGLAYWLPDFATVEARSDQQYWRNDHRFSDYRLFAVDAGVEIVDSDTEGENAGASQ